jgi:DNA (cytosine-5)-methyltransferase 1
VSDVRGADLPDCDVVAFGSPCQDLSVAGKRAGMVVGETRSGLFYEAIRIIKELKDDGRHPTWVIWENVVGALSSNNGLDFAAVLDSLAELGALESLDWRVLDAQFFGVPQRRRRVFVVARFDSGAAGRGPVLPLGARVPRDSATGDEAGQEVAGTLGGGSGSRSWAPDTDRMTFVPDVLTNDYDRAGTPNRIGTITTRWGNHYDAHQEVVSGSVIPVPAPEIPEITGTVTTTWAKGPGNTQVEEGCVIPVLSPFVEAKRAANKDDFETWESLPISPTLNRIDNTSDAFATVLTVAEEPQYESLAVRRLTPLECERLQGWDDNWTAVGIDGTGKEVVIADSSRYRMVGNGVAAPVAEWVGRCIVAAHAEVES